MSNANDNHTTGSKLANAARIGTPAGVAALVVLGFNIRGTLDTIETGIAENCRVSATMENALRTTIATEIRDPQDRRRVLTLFPPVRCK